MGVGRLERVHGKDARGSTVTGIRIMTDDQILEVVQAHKEGKKIQSLSVYESDVPHHWRDVRFGETVNQLPVNWDFTRFIYRVEPEPRKPREFEIILDNNDEIWNDKSFHHCHAINHERIRVREVIE